MWMPKKPLWYAQPSFNGGKLIWQTAFDYVYLRNLLFLKSIQSGSVLRLRNSLGIISRKKRIAAIGAFFWCYGTEPNHLANGLITGMAALHALLQAQDASSLRAKARGSADVRRLSVGQLVCAAEAVGALRAVRHGQQCQA